MRNYNHQMNDKFVSQPIAWALLCVYGTAVDDLFNQGDYSTDIS
jgi:hypothetical protein